MALTLLWQGNAIHVPAGEYLPHDYAVEADWSAAAFWFALQAILPQLSIVLDGLRKSHLQGDACVAEIFASMGINGTWKGEELHLDCSRVAQCCCSTFADLNGTPDLAPTLVVALCLLGRPFRITAWTTWCIKESDLPKRALNCASWAMTCKSRATRPCRHNFETVESHTPGHQPTHRPPHGNGLCAGCGQIPGHRHQ